MSRHQEKHKILIVDDNKNTLEIIHRNLVKKGYETFTSDNVAQAIHLLRIEKIDLIITDIKMPGTSGMDLVKHVRDNYKDSEIMIITGYPSIESAVEAVKSGAEEYLVKPFTEDELIQTVENILKKLFRRRRVQTTEQNFPQYGIIGDSPATKEVFRLIDKATKTLAHILITGASGTGKELVARAIHYNSPRSSAPFVPVNCTAIPDNLLESELFGHVKGAFTDAKFSRAGFFQIADKGTLFLDEIGDASMTMQAKLLRAIERGEIFMVGSSQVHHVDTRIIAASHKDLKEMVRKGHFREDLYYRLNVIDIHIPPLCERGDDVLLLVNHFTARFSREMNKKIPKFSARSLEALKNYRWPGNVRELENHIQRLTVLVDEPVIHINDLPSSMRFTVTQEKNLHRTLAAVEQEHIRNVLNSVGGNKSKAAEILGIDRKTLRRKLEKSPEPE